jgi:hypothetical protein
VQWAFCRRPAAVAAVICFVPPPEVGKQEEKEGEMVRMGKMGWGPAQNGVKLGRGARNAGTPLTLTYSSLLLVQTRTLTEAVRSWLGS